MQATRKETARENINNIDHDYQHYYLQLILITDKDLFVRPPRLFLQVPLYLVKHTSVQNTYIPLLQ